MVSYIGIMAMNKRNVIGRNNKLPWHIPEDLQYFRQLTEHNVVIMGRKTFESLPTGPLKNRINIIITRDPEKYKEEIQKDVFYCAQNEVGELLENMNIEKRKVFVIGGAEIYKIFFPFYTEIYLTVVLNEEQRPDDVYSPFTVNDLEKYFYTESEKSIIHTSKKTQQRYYYVKYSKTKTNTDNK